MSNCPDYRLRLFLSIDLVGSTSFKNGPGKQAIEGDGSQPRWVNRIRHFYREFPALVRQEFKKTVESRDESNLLPPQVWKTVGDEILMCSRVKSLQHLADCTTAFLNALKTYGAILEGDGKELDVKGTGWVAAFPCPNITVALDNDLRDVDQFDEMFEMAADKNPNSVDFLGNSIDAGFRIATRAASDRFVVSVELAWLLAEASHRQIFRFEFGYHERQVLKGVLQDKPYPIISVNTERSALRRDVLESERVLTGEGKATDHALRIFLPKFMADENIELPVIVGEQSPIPCDAPRSYQVFRDAWLTTVEAIKARTDAEADAATVDGQGDSELQPEIEELARQSIAGLKKLE